MKKLLSLLALIPLLANGQAVPTNYPYARPLPTNGVINKSVATRVSAPIAPTAYNNKYPAVWDNMIGGGYRVVGTIAERNAINPGWRKQGMKVYVTADSTEYILGADLTTWSAGGGASLQYYTVANETARFALTSLHNGDVAKQVDDGTAWLLIDSTNSQNHSGWSNIGDAWFLVYYGGSVDPSDVGDMFVTPTQKTIHSYPYYTAVSGTPMIQIAATDYGLNGIFTNLNLFSSTLIDITIPGNLLSETNISFSTFSNLVGLSIASNKFTSFNGTGLTSLSSLNISGNEPTLSSFISGHLASLDALSLTGFTNLSTLNISGWSNVNNLVVTGAKLSSASVNNTLTNLAWFGLMGGTVDLSGGTSATTNAAGSAAVQTLVGNGWTVTHN